MEKILLFILLLVVPAVVGMIISFPFWFWKGVSNDVIKVLFWVGVIGIGIFVYQTAFADGRKLFFFILLAIALYPNLIVGGWYTKRLHLNRCSKCGSMKMVIEEENISNRRKRYILYCSECNSVFKY